MTEQRTEREARAEDVRAQYDRILTGFTTWDEDQRNDGISELITRVRDLCRQEAADNSRAQREALDDHLADAGDGLGLFLLGEIEKTLGI